MTDIPDVLEVAKSGLLSIRSLLFMIQGSLI